MENPNKAAGWLLCTASLVLLASVGKLDLLLVLLPVSALLSLILAAPHRARDNADRQHRRS